MNRRKFLSAATGDVLQSVVPAASSGQFIKSICVSIFSADVPYSECFRKAKSAGFDGMEIQIGREINLDSTPAQVRRVAEVAGESGISIASLWVSRPLRDHPLNSPDPTQRARGVAAIRRAIEFAQYLECGALLLVPGGLGHGPKFEVGYKDTWERLTVELKRVIPLAERAKVFLTIENVWNRFLVSPLEMCSFVDQFHSPYFRTHFDIGNIMQYGYPQDWILTLGSRVKRVHVKDYLLKPGGQGRFIGLLEGDVDWRAVMQALVEVGYRGFLSHETGHDPSDPDKLKKVSRALDTILSMA